MSIESTAVPSNNLPARSAGSPTLPITHDLRYAIISSLLIAILTIAASLAGILTSGAFYPDKGSYLANDVVNLVVGLPILIISLWLVRQGKLLGLLFWPGALLYGLYNYVAYLFGVPLTAVYPLYLIIVTMSLYTLIWLVAVIDATTVKERLYDRIPRRLTGGVLVGLGVLFAIRAFGVLISALVNQTLLPTSELGLAVADVLLATAWIIGGFFLLKQLPFGYVSGAGLLFSGTMLFAGLLTILGLSPLFEGEPLPVTDIVAVLIMGLVVFVPCGLFVRGIRVTF